MRLDLYRCTLSLSQDGDLEITPAHGPQGRFLVKSWERGFTAYRLIGSVRYAVPLWDTVLLNAASRLPSGDTQRKFIAGIPAEVIEAVSHYRFGQCLLLHMLATCPEARDLLNSNPNLLWLLMFAAYERRVPIESIAACCRMKQPALLEKAIGIGSPSLVRLLNRIEISGGQWRDAWLLKHALFNETIVKSIRHLGPVPLRLMELLYRHREFRSSLMARLLANHMATNVILDSRADYIAYCIQQIIEFSKRLGIREGEHIIRSCRSIDDIYRLHLRWQRRMLEEQVNPTFPPPPLPSSDDVQAIESLSELRDEGCEQRNCVVDYMERIASGEVYIYRVLRPSRATLALRRSGGRWALGQFKLAGNQVPDAAARRTVEGWFRDGIARAG